MPGSNLVITQGANNYSFSDVTAIPVRIKPRTGETLRLTARQKRDDQLDAPWSVSNISGLGVSRAGDFQLDADNRCWEMVNMQAWPGMVCLGPAGRTTTDVAGTRQTIGFMQFRNNLFAFADVAGLVTTETIQTWSVTGTWGDGTAVADFNTAVGTNQGFLCVGMVDQDGQAYALRTVFYNAGAARWQMVKSTDGTTWSVIDHANAADCPGPSTTYLCKGLLSILGVMYTATLNASSQILLRQNAAGNNGVTWTTTATSKESVTSITGLIVFTDYAGVDRPVVLTPEGAFLWDGTSFYKFLPHQGENDATAGKNPVLWPVDGIEGGYLAYPKGKKLIIQTWGPNNTPIAYNIAPTFNTQGLPLIRDGLITALAATNNFLFAAIGGDSATTTAGIYLRRAEYLHPLGWSGPFYDVATANRQIRAMFVSSYSDGVVRLHVSLDNGTANDTDLIYFDNITSDPRQVTSYLHTTATGQIILPKNDRGLPELNKAWRKQEAIGTNLSATNQIAAVYANADAAPLASNGSWGTTLGAITASANSVNFAATPSGTGLSARAVQTRYTVTGTSNASPYIEAWNTYVVAYIPPKYIHSFAIPLTPGGTAMSRAKKLADLKSIISGLTDCSVLYGEMDATIMEPYWGGGRILTYTDELDKIGSVNAHSNVKFALLELVEV